MPCGRVRMFSLNLIRLHVSCQFCGGWDDVFFCQQHVYCSVFLAHPEVGMRFTAKNPTYGPRQNC